MKYLVLLIICIISSCANRDENLSVSNNFNTDKLYTLGLLFEYCEKFDSIFEVSNKKQNDLFEIINYQNFIKTSLLHSIKDSVIFNDEAVSYLLKPNEHNILKINIKKIDKSYFF